MRMVTCECCGWYGKYLAVGDRETEDGDMMDVCPACEAEESFGIGGDE